uniref:Uncharacterized protein n=1 Tax=Rhizophagus irregularis (strain DAOM 181602 / DAOM 197198 / MUCL 43194) TaxID=747089 RepID=U9UQZ4_RHIID
MPFGLYEFLVMPFGLAYEFILLIKINEKNSNTLASKYVYPSDKEYIPVMESTIHFLGNPLDYAQLLETIRLYFTNTMQSVWYKRFLKEIAHLGTNVKEKVFIDLNLRLLQVLVKTSQKNLNQLCDEVKNYAFRN